MQVANAASYAKQMHQVAKVAKVAAKCSRFALCRLLLKQRYRAMLILLAAKLLLLAPVAHAAWAPCINFDLGDAQVGSIRPKQGVRSGNLSKQFL